MNLSIYTADLSDPIHANGMLEVLDSYAADIMGGGKNLADDVRERLPSMLRDHPTALVLLASADHRHVGVAVCFFALSTFRARPSLNIHDLAVVPDYRGRGIGRALLRAVENEARRKGCCRLTLEVLDDNTRARGLYRSFGFDDFMPGSSAATRFLVKPLEV